MSAPESGLGAPAGPAPRDVRLDTLRLARGARWWCVHEAIFPAVSANPNLAGAIDDPSTGGRFHPFEDVAGRRVGTCYLSDHPNGAFAEVLLRGRAPVPGLPARTIAAHRLFEIEVLADLQLADFTAPAAGSSLHRALHADAGAYPALRRVAAQVHARRPALDGIVWTGRQLGIPGMRCLVLFADRAGAAIGLRAVATLELDRGEGLSRLLAAAAHRGWPLPGAVVPRA